MWAPKPKKGFMCGDRMKQISSPADGKPSRRRRERRLLLSQWIDLNLRALPILPEDVVREILLRLPVKSLLRFRTVSKSWLFIISEPYFINSHYQFAAKKKPSIVVSQKLYRTPKYYEYMSVPKIFSSDSYYGIISTCNGIVCVTNLFGLGIYLWNPSMKQYKKLPTLNIFDEYLDRVIGFGYDSVSDDYKVICFKHRVIDKFVKVVQLFSTNLGYWKEIRVDIRVPCCLFHYNGGVLINGHLYFEERDKKKELISFNLHTEVFGVVPLHKSMKRKRSNLLDFEGSLAMVIVNSITDGSFHGDSGQQVLKEISLWTLEDGDDGGVYWIKKFIFEDDFKIGWVNLYMGAGIFYGRNSIDGYYSPGYDIIRHICYDYKKKVEKSFRLVEAEYPKILKYTESLVSFEGFEFTGAEAVAWRPIYLDSTSPSSSESELLSDDCCPEEIRNTVWRSQKQSRRTAAAAAAVP